MKRYKINRWLLMAVLALALPMLTACSDEPDSENFRTFDDEMMSTYLQNRYDEPALYLWIIHLLCSQ